jgi:hypothetical protein
MKYFYILFSVLICLGFVTNFTLRFRNRNKFTIQHGNKNLIKNLNSKALLKDKKNGPINWGDDLDSGLDYLLKNERGLVNNLNKQVKYDFTPSQSPAFLSEKTTITKNSNTALSENQKSKTFRSVGPYDDSTVDSSGKKYSKMFRRETEKKDINAGYYGGSRLTR